MHGNRAAVAPAHPARAIEAPRKQAGVTLLELLVVLVMLGIVMGVGALYLRPMETPLQVGGSILEGSLKQARARAVATTTVHRVRPASQGSLVVEFGVACDTSSWTADPRFDIELPEEVTLSDTSWTVCFSRRGVASQNLVLTLNHPEFGSRSLEVLKGGMTRWLP